MAGFKPLSAYTASLAAGYSLLPFRFHRLRTGSVFLSNLVGEWEILPADCFAQFVDGRLQHDSDAYADLKAKHFLIDADSSVAVDLLSTKLQRRLSHLPAVFGLAIFVVTLRCEHSCPYCQVSRQSDDRSAYDMTEGTARLALEKLMASPIRVAKIEFQGGEPLLNFDLIRYVVLTGKQMAATAGKSFSFVVTTNLALISDDILVFCREHNILISTSLDGPADLHNANRPRKGNNSHQLAVEGMKRAAATLGENRVAALMTTTKASLSRVEDIVDEYRRNGLQEIFLRPLSPYGFAVKTKWFKAYESREWLDFYLQGLRYIIDMNRRGERMVELYALTILSKMLTGLPGGYVDMMNPAGIANKVVVFNYDGDVYASDEARMLAEMGDKTFRLGNLLDGELADLATGDTILDAIEGSVLESSPMCSDCAFQPYCGADPIFHHATQGDFTGHKPTSGFCQRQMAIFNELVGLMETDREVAAILRGWVS